jgi:hypothetical protein
LEELMGLLDDAIREHLELKRRRGADLDEIARQEDEALGDPRSGEFAQPGAEPQAEAEIPAGEELPAEPPAPAPAAVVFDAEPEPEPEPEPDAAPEPEPVPAEQPWLDDDRIDPVDAPPAAEQAPPAAEPAPRGEGEEDVLEETPDFLQETPEHERLWFEQKPPRDFDFDN